MRGLSFPSKVDKDHHGSQAGSVSGGHSLASKLMKKVSSTVKGTNFRGRKNSNPSTFRGMHSPIISRDSTSRVGFPVVHPREGGNATGRAMTFSVGSLADQPNDPSNVEREIPFFGEARKPIPNPQPGVTVVRGKPAWQATRAARAHSTVSAADTGAPDPYAAIRSSLPPTPTSPMASFKMPKTVKPPRAPTSVDPEAEIMRKKSGSSDGRSGIKKKSASSLTGKQTPVSPSSPAGSITSPVLPGTPISPKLNTLTTSRNSGLSSTKSPGFDAANTQEKNMASNISPMLKAMLPPTLAQLEKKQGPLPPLMTRRAYTSHEASPNTAGINGQRQSVLREMNRNSGASVKTIRKEQGPTGSSMYRRQLSTPMEGTKAVNEIGWVHRIHDEHTARERRPRGKGCKAGNPMSPSIVGTRKKITHPCHKSEMSVLTKCAAGLRKCNHKANVDLEVLNKPCICEAANKSEGCDCAHQKLLEHFQEYQASVNNILRMIEKRCGALENLYTSSANYSKAFSQVYNIDEDTSAQLLRECEAELDQENLDPVAPLR